MTRDRPAGPLLTVKYTAPPVRPGAIARSRLEQLLRDAVSRLTLVTAPAGWGKTSLLSRWAADPGPDVAVAWVSLDEGDDDPVRFWRYVLTALHEAGAVGPAALEALIARGNFAAYFAPDVTLHLMGTDQAAHGSDAVEAMIRYFHEQAFDLHPELKCLLVDGERATVEAEFVGRHIGEFAGRAATGKDVRVPYSVVFDLEGDRIKALRFYFPLDQLLQQIDEE